MSCPQVHIDLGDLFNFPGLAHVYLTDLNHVVLSCNSLQLQVFEDILRLPKQTVLGNSLVDLLKDTLETEEILSVENEWVMQHHTAKQFINTWFVDSQHTIELLTLKMPAYNDYGKVVGVFGISHYMNRFNLLRASELGLSKKQTTCLFHRLQGKSNTQIAQEFNSSVNTIQNYFDQMKSNLNCSNETEILIKALKTKLPRNVQCPLIHGKQVINTLPFQMYSDATNEFAPWEISNGKNVVLSKQEISCVHYLCQGWTLKQIGKQLKISPKTVETYLERAKIKTHCSNKAQLVSIFMHHTRHFASY